MGVKEHFFTDKTSSILVKTINQSIIDHASTSLKEAIYIQWLNPKINRQKKVHVSTY